MLAIKTVGLTKDFGGKRAVDHLDLEIEEDTLFSLLGVNGAGKTTTIKMLSCLSRPTSGDASVLGLDLKKDQMEIKKIMNVSPQETAVAPNLTVRENLEFVAGIYGHPRARCREMADRTIEEFGMQEIEKSKAKTLSGGWQRRLSIALALISEPKILFLDEPTLGLDVLARRELWHVIEKLKNKMTIILTTHYLEEAEAISDRIGIMSKGKLKAVGTAQELKEKTGKTNFEDAFIEIAQEVVR